MIQELPVFEAWQNRANLKIYASLNPKTPCRLYKLPNQFMPDNTAIYEVVIANGQKVFRSGFQTIYARKLNWLEKLWRKLS